MGKYKVGDKVRITNGFMARNMKEMEGKILTVKSVEGTVYCVCENNYFWTEEMFEPATSQMQEDVKHILNQLCDFIERHGMNQVNLCVFGEGDGKKSSANAFCLDNKYYIDEWVTRQAPMKLTMAEIEERLGGKFEIVQS